LPALPSKFAGLQQFAAQPLNFVAMKFVPLNFVLLNFAEDMPMRKKR
jgi:hypothetical protein